MITGSYARVSSRVWLCVAVAALGLMAVSPHLPSRVNAQTVPAQTAQTRRHRQGLQADSVAKVGALDSVATVHVDVTPEHILNTIYPDTATGAWMDDLEQDAGGQPEQARDDSGGQEPGLGFHHHAQQ